MFLEETYIIACSVRGPPVFNNNILWSITLSTFTIYGLIKGLGDLLSWTQCTVLSTSQNKVTDQLMPWCQACDFTENRTSPGNGVANHIWWTEPILWHFGPLINDNWRFDRHWSILMWCSRMPCVWYILVLPLCCTL